jgi:hypothetical protein
MKITSRNKSQKVTKMQLKHLLDVSYPTALKEYAIIIDSLQIKRNFLIINDLIRYGILT